MLPVGQLQIIEISDRFVTGRAVAYVVKLLANAIGDRRSDMTITNIQSLRWRYAVAKIGKEYCDHHCSRKTV